MEINTLKHCFLLFFKLFLGQWGIHWKIYAIYIDPFFIILIIKLLNSDPNIKLFEGVHSYKSFFDQIFVYIGVNIIAQIICKLFHFKHVIFRFHRVLALKSCNILFVCVLAVIKCLFGEITRHVFLEFVPVSLSTAPKTIEQASNRIYSQSIQI